MKDYFQALVAWEDLFFPFHEVWECCIAHTALHWQRPKYKGTEWTPYVRNDNCITDIISLNETKRNDANLKSDSPDSI